MKSFRKPVISRTFNSFPALRSGSAGVLPPCFSFFDAIFWRTAPDTPRSLSGLRVGAEGLFSQFYGVFLTNLRSLILASAGTSTDRGRFRMRSGFWKFAGGLGFTTAMAHLVGLVVAKRYLARDVSFFQDLNYHLLTLKPLLNSRCYFPKFCRISPSKIDS